MPRIMPTRAGYMVSQQHEPEPSIDEFPSNRSQLAAMSAPRST